MGRGFGGVEDASKEVNERRQAAGGFVPRFRLAGGETATVRFLEEGDDVHWAWVAQMPPRGNQRFGDYEPTRDQKKDGSTPCPLAENKVPLMFRGWINLIWRDAPVYKRNAEGRMVKDPSGKYVIEGRKDGVFIWEAGITVFEELAALDRAFKGLCSRDFQVRRIGSDQTTRYGIIPANPDGGPQDMSANDKELASKKHDLTPFVTPKSYEDLQRLMGGQAAAANSGQGGSEFNPFMDNN
jgi:hypothetical protein